MIEIVGIDADDTLWDEASLFDAAEGRFVAQVSAWTGSNDVQDNLRKLHFALIDEVGYGPVGYRKALRQFSRDQLPADLQASATALADEICDWIEGTRIVPLTGVADALARLKRTFRLILITKGDRAWQSTKLDHSGLAHVFDDLHIVDEKDSSLYARLFGRPTNRPHAAMIGNSVKSDILPAIEAGALGLHVPFHRTSPLEAIDWSGEHSNYRQFPNLQHAADWLLNEHQPG